MLDSIIDELILIKCELVTQNMLFCMKEKYNLGQISKDEYTESINGIYSNLRAKEFDQ